MSAAKAWFSRALAPTCDRLCNLQNRMRLRGSRDSRWKAGPTSAPTRPHPRARTVRRVGADARREARICVSGSAPELPKFPTPTPRGSSPGAAARRARGCDGGGGAALDV
eukprot:gene15298-biopygen3669